MATSASAAVWCSAAGAVVGGARFFWPPFADGQPRRFAIGRHVDFKPGTLTWLREVELFVHRADNGFGAFSSRCTHLGCSVRRTDEGFVCPCHGARYDALGRVATGPARRALPWYRLQRLAGDRIWIDLDQPVPTGTLFALAEIDSGSSSRAQAPAGGPRTIGESDREYVRERDPDSLLGGEIGLDHVGLAVSALPAAQRHYQERLGFSNGQPGKLENGLANVNFYFGDTTYLELLTPVDEQRAPDVAAFVRQRGSAPMFLVLCVFSVEETAVFLRNRGLTVGEPRPGRIETPGMASLDRPLWHTLFFSPSPLPGDPLYFIAYDRKVRNFLNEQVSRRHIRRRAFSHTNTALGLKGTWIVVRDLAAAATAYANIGLSRREEVHYPQLGAQGVELEAGHGSLLLLTPNRRTSPLQVWLAAAGEGIFGVTIEVESIATAGAVVANGLGIELELYDGWLGRSLLVPPEHAGGLWLELAERRT